MTIKCKTQHAPDYVVFAKAFLGGKSTPSFCVKDAYLNLIDETRKNDESGKAQNMNTRPDIAQTSSPNGFSLLQRDFHNCALRIPFQGEAMPCVA